MAQIEDTICGLPDHVCTHLLFSRPIWRILCQSSVRPSDLDLDFCPLEMFNVCTVLKVTYREMYEIEAGCACQLMD